MIFPRKKKFEITEEQSKLDILWDLWVEENADSPYAELMTYQSEINNGGHDQYFLNVGNTSDLQKEMSVLESVLPAELKNNLQKAYKAYLMLDENEDDEDAEDIMEQCDSVFYENEEAIMRILEEYAEKMEL